MMISDNPGLRWGIGISIFYEGVNYSFPLYDFHIAIGSDKKVYFSTSNFL